MIILDKIYNFIQIKIRKVNIGKYTKLNGKVIFKGINKVSIGENCIINSGIRKNPLLNHTYCSIGGSTGHVKIGNNVGISNSCIYSDLNIEIEDGVLIGNSCTIMDTDFYLINNCSNIVKKKKFTIKKNAWIGANSIVLKGATIGENSIVAAGAVVTKSIPSNQVCGGGKPAKFIKNII